MIYIVLSRPWSICPRIYRIYMIYIVLSRAWSICPRCGQYQEYLPGYMIQNILLRNVETGMVLGDCNIPGT